MSTLAPIIVAGHACLDLIPVLPAGLALAPGTLTQVGPAAISTGGAVPNVGLALHRLGAAARLVGTIGDDPFGRALADHLASFDPTLGRSLLVLPGGTTSYSIVVGVPGLDRAFWHCSGVNDVFDPDAVPDTTLADAAWLHFGYPPIMRRVCDDPASLRRLLDRARAAGARTSLDLCSIDPASFAGQVDWRAWLTTVLPAVDVFTPSFEETCVALGYREMPITRTNVEELARELRSLGTPAVLLKLGDVGAYYQDATMDAHAPCFAVDFAGATGAGDSTIAGFLAGMTSGRGVEASLQLAVAAGGASCERHDATSGIPTLAELEARIAAGWRRSDKTLR